jgi:hypothetical protein
MCEFYSPTGIVRRQLVSRQNVMIKPRLNIIAAGHPKRTIECLTGQILEKKEKKEVNNFMQFIFKTITYYYTYCYEFFFIIL